MWWRIVLAIISASLTLAVIVVWSGVVTVKVALAPGQVIPKPMMFAGVPAGFFIIATVIVGLATPLAVRLFRRR